MAYEQEIGAGASDDLAAHLVSGRADDGTPEPRGEQREEDDEQ